MKKFLLTMTAAFMLQLGLSSWANAALTVLEDGVIWDDVANQYWLQRGLREFLSLTYAEQIDKIALLNGPTGTGPYGTWGDWHMAQGDEMDGLWANPLLEIGEVFDYSSWISHGGGGTGNYSAAYWGRTDVKFIDPDYPSGLHELHLFELLHPREDFDSPYVYDPLTVRGLDDLVDSFFIGAWVTADAAPVPVPATLLLLGAGLSALAGVKAKKVHDQYSS